MLYFLPALRSLLRQRQFFATAVAALALGIAAPTALFSVVNAALLRPLPYANAGDIYTVRTTMTDGRFTIGMVASEELMSMKRGTELVADAALVFRADDTLEAGGVKDAQQIVTVGVSERFFDLFGVPMAMGRAFNVEDHESKEARSVVLSGRAWRNLFSADPSILGKTIRLGSGNTGIVVGVAPDSFDAPHDTDFWFAGRWPENVGHFFDAYVRLKPGTTPVAIQGALAPMWNALAEKYRDQEKNRIFAFRPLLSSIVGDLGPTALIAFAATALLLLLAIANAANLLLARSIAQTREIAMRIAIGARRSHLIRQLLAESMVIALAAAMIGVPLAYGAVRGILLLGGKALPRADGLGFDPWVALFVAGIVMLTSLVVGLLPALTTSDVQLMSVVKEGGRGGSTGPRTRRVLSALVVSEIALAIALVAGAGRLLLSARNLLTLDPGFAAEGRLVVDVLLPVDYVKEPERAMAWSNEVSQRLHDLGATHVGMASSLPLRREWDSTTFADIVGRPVPPQLRPNGRARVVNPELFDAMGMRIVAGRGFSIDDRASRAPVAMVNEAWVAKFLPPGTDPLREQISSLIWKRVGDKWEPQNVVIIGVAKDVRYSSLDKDPEPTIYMVDSQRVPLQRSYVVTTSDGRPEKLIPQIREALHALDPQVPVQFDTMADVVMKSLVWSRLGVLLMGTFGVIALVLVGTGVFGVLAFVGAQRHGEMAIRLCLGATRRGVSSLMFAQGVRYVIAGAIVGLGLAWWTGQLMSLYVYQVGAANGVVLLGSVLTVAIVALGAAMSPARRASRVEPSEALRS